MSASSDQNAQMAKMGYPHVYHEDVPDPALSEEARLNYAMIDSTASALGWSLATGVAYEADGETVKKGYIRIFYN